MSFAADVHLDIEAPPAIVWRFLSDPERFAAWIGAFAGQPPLPGTRIDPRVGGAIHVSYPHGHAGEGVFTEVVVEQRVVFTWGFSNGMHGLEPGASRIAITLTPVDGGTRVRLVHELLPSQELADQVGGGWAHYLTMLAANLGRDHHGAQWPDRVDAYYAAWAEPDADARQRALEQLVAEAVRVRTGFAHLDGRAALAGHITGSQRHMPGMRMVRTTPVASSHTHGLWSWELRGPDGSVLGEGRSTGRLDAEGRLAEVVHFAR